MPARIGAATRAALLWALGAACAAPLCAGESAGTTAARVAKQLAQEESYRLTASVRGGKAKGDDHQLVDVTVDQTWTADVTGKLCALTAPCQAFRLRADASKGAVREGTRWMAILATEDGRKAARLCPGPEATLARALRWKQKAEWVAPAGAPQPSAPAEGEGVEEGGQAQAPAGTREGGKSSPAEAPAQPTSHHIRIEGPAQVAVEVFTEITNSGCFSAG